MPEAGDNGWSAPNLFRLTLKLSMAREVEIWRKFSRETIFRRGITLGKEALAWLGHNFISWQYLLTMANCKNRYLFLFSFLDSLQNFSSNESPGPKNLYLLEKPKIARISYFQLCIRIKGHIFIDKRKYCLGFRKECFNFWDINLIMWPKKWANRQFIWEY